MSSLLNFFFEDEETCSPQKSLTAYQFLKNVRKVDIVIASCLEGAAASAPIAKRDGIPYFISGRSTKEFQKSNPNALSWLSLLNYEGAAIADLIVERKWTSGTAMVWNGYFGVQFADAISAAVKEKSSDFRFEKMEVDQGAAPTGGDVQRLLRNKPQVVFLMMSEPAAAFVVKQLRALHYQGTIILQSSMLQTYDQGARSPFESALQQKFEVNAKRFDQLQVELRAQLKEEVADDFVFSYDGFQALLQAANLCRSQGVSALGTCLTNSLRNETWREGVSGKFRFMKDGSTERPMLFKKITATGFEEL